MSRLAAQPVAENNEESLLWVTTRVTPTIQGVGCKIQIPSREQMVDARLPLHFRDLCSGILIPLNECRRETLYLPWKCQDLRHAYEKCQHDEWKKRVAVLKQNKRG